MKSVMSMRIDTTWGNSIELAVESELDNAHDLTTAELARLQVFTLSMMVAEVRRENERELRIKDESDPERSRFAAMERERATPPGQS